MFNTGGVGGVEGAQKEEVWVYLFNWVFLFLFTAMTATNFCSPMLSLQKWMEGCQEVSK